MKYMIDIDGTICTQQDSGNYDKAEPHVNRINHINQLYDQGHEINFWTARGSVTGINWQELTKQQLNDWGVKYHTVSFNKPPYDIWIDDKAMSDKEFFNDIDNRS